MDLMTQPTPQTSADDSSSTIQLFVGATLLLVLGAWLLMPSSRSFFVQTVVQKPAVSQLVAVIGRARVTFNFGAKKRIFEGPITDGETIAQALKQASDAGKINLIWKEIGGLTGLVGVDTYLNGEKNWQAYLNGQKLQSSLYETKVNTNDEILLFYQ